MMRRSAGSYQRSGVLKPRNSNVTPTSRSGPSARKSYLPKPGGGDSVPRAGVGAKNRRTDNGTARLSGRVTPVRNMLTVNPSISSSVSRMSVDSNRSSIGGQARKETRPITDSSFKSRCIDKVIWFLQARGYEYEVTRRVLLHPTTKDFTNIFQFIYRHLEPNYTLPPKYEDEIPKVLRSQKYPVQISKASYLTVGSPHTWPTFLAMLSWFIDVVSAFDSADPYSVAFPDNFEGTLNMNRVRFETYVEYCITGQADHVIENFKTQLEINANLQPMHHLYEELKLLDEEIITYRENPEKVKELQHQHMKIEHDKDKMLIYCQDMQKHIEILANDRSHLEIQFDREKQERAQVQEKVTWLEQLKTEQNLSPSEVNYIKNRASKIGTQLAQLEDEEKELELLIGTAEMGISKAQESFSGLARQINALWLHLELGSEFAIDTANFEEKQEYWEEELIPELKIIKKNTKQKTCNTQMCKINEEKELFMMQEILKEDCNERAKLESKLARLEEELQINKDEITQKESKMDEEAEKLRGQILATRKGQTSSLYQKQCELEETVKSCEEHQNSERERIKTSVNYFVKVCHGLVDNIRGQQEEIEIFLRKITKPFEELEEDHKTI
ncbi:kinetochore protein NDC80 homolog [Oratosquilla oratoria]|uniref:kinetochore protein NDC80 homolog n=1 Tax=Oratosquilla oratoria TaxID=337810 RepID=UPI003F767744